LISEQIQVDQNQATPADILPQDTAFIQFSSGSTGEPKGVVLSHHNLMTNIRSILIGSAATQDDVSLSWMPLTHDMGIIGFHLSPLVLNTDVYLMSPELFVRRPNLWLDKISEKRATVSASPNFGYSFPALSATINSLSGTAVPSKTNSKLSASFTATKAILSPNCSC
jgi:acyl-CoA synthetase (AMP-forming)/AMP-acid ligase II